MKINKLLVLLILVAIIYVGYTVAFSESGFLRHRDALIEDGTAGQVPVLETGYTEPINNNYSISLEKEDTDGTFQYAIIDTEKQKTVRTVNYLSFQEHRPLYEPLGKGDYIVARQVILKNNGELINVDEEFGALFRDYAIHKNSLAVVLPDAERNRTTNDCTYKVCVLDMSNDYSVETVDSFTIPWEYYFIDKFTLAYDKHGNLYYDYYDETPQIKCLDTSGTTSQYLEGASHAQISPYDDFIIYVDMKSYDKEDRTNAMVVLHSLTSNESVLRLANTMKAFWGEQKLIIYNDQEDCFDIYSLKDKCKKTGVLDIGIGVTDIMEEGSDSYSVKMFKYTKDSIAPKTIKVKTKAIN